MEGYQKIQGIMKVIRLGLPSPKTLFITDYEKQKSEINNFMMEKELVMIRSEKKDQSMNCPRNLKCSKIEAKNFIKELNGQGYVAILQEYVPLDNIYSGNILMLKNSFIIEAMHGGPVSKLNREGVLHEHVRTDKAGNVIMHHGENVVPIDDIRKMISTISKLPLEYHIVEFSKGPNWMYYWHAREDKTSKKLE